ncbi:hypothetical protein RchiOBHm_Chr2g0162781 [Rosa chinensis]|uniref:Uncharacterized protein n=1 Tax=Rosa chinensis TaxID=74649 RepID=A0A2P6S365_ROSCH|nr:hypothetical protein RchiOBHm_Chr2g0162781 [Rosa chinensis]
MLKPPSGLYIYKPVSSEPLIFARRTKTKTCGVISFFCESIRTAIVIILPPLKPLAGSYKLFSDDASVIRDA